MEFSASADIGGHGASVTVSLDLPSHHHHDHHDHDDDHHDDDLQSPPRPPVRPTERSDLETNIQDVVEREMEQMFEELKEEDRIQEDVTMNEMELLRLKLKYKYKYKYKYEVKKSQDRSTPLLGDSWDLDPALKDSGVSAIAGGASYQEPAPEPESEDELELEFGFCIPSEFVTQDEVEKVEKEGKKHLDEVWTKMAVPPLETTTMDKKQLRELLRENRQALLPQERALKELLRLLRDLSSVLKEAQKSSQNADGVQELTTQHQKADPAVGNEKVQKALADLGEKHVSDVTLTAKLIRALRHHLGIKQKAQEESGASESPGWNKSVFVEKKGRHVQATNTKKAGFREFKADPWFRKMSRYG